MGESLSLDSGVPHAGHGPRSPGCGPSGWTSHLSLTVWLVMQTIWDVDRQGWPCGGVTATEGQEFEPCYVPESP